MREWLTILIVISIISVVTLFSFNLPQLRFATDLLQQPLAILMTPFHGPADGLSGWWRTMEQAGDLQAENDLLKERIGSLETEIARLQELGRENEHLREQLRLQMSEPNLHRAMARVVARDPNSLLRSVIVVPVMDEQFREGMIVVTSAGLVGRVVQANPRAAKVLLLTDTTSAVTAMDQETRAAGVVVGQRGSLLLMRYIPQGDVVRPGDVVLTSGVGGLFPEGLNIGRIVSVTRRDVDLYQQALIEPAVDFDSLERVMIITNYIPLRLE